MRNGVKKWLIVPHKLIAYLFIMLAHAAPQHEVISGLITVESVRLEQELLPERLRMYCCTNEQIKDPKYQNLAGLQLKVEERNWICEEVDRKHDARYDMCITKKGLIRRYSLYDNFFKKNWRSYQKYGVTMPPGVPPIGSLPSERTKMETFLKKRRNGLTFAELSDELTAVKKARKNETIAFTPAEKLDEKVHPKTTEAFVKRCGVELTR